MSGPIKTVPNEGRCLWTEETHEFEIHSCCPVSGNPMPGSIIAITYEPDSVILEVANLYDYVHSYRGGKGDIRSMEGMIQAIAQDAATSLGVGVKVSANLYIKPDQKMKLRCSAWPPE